MSGTGTGQAAECGQEFPFPLSLKTMAKDGDGINRKCGVILTQKKNKKKKREKKQKQTAQLHQDLLLVVIVNCLTGSETWPRAGGKEVVSTFEA